MTRKLNKTFYFSVEGETEGWYLEWLQSQINSSEELKISVSLKYKIQKDPIAYVKSQTFLYPSEIWQLSDYESADADHAKIFFQIMDKMREAEQCGKDISYKFGYSNFTFDLWIILHKFACNRHLYNRTQYIKFINKYFNKNFSDMDDYKHEKNFKSVLSACTLEDVKEAIQNSKRIMKSNQEIGYVLKNYKGFDYYDENPSLMIWQAIENVLIECGYIKD